MASRTPQSPKLPSAEAGQRAAVIAAARGWIGTRFHDNAEVKGHGVDCARLLAKVYAEAGIIPAQAITPYSAQWMLHNDEPLFEGYVLRFAHRVDLPKPADVVLYKIGRQYAHGAIVVAWPGAIIHAFKTYGLVAETGADESDLLDKPRRFYSFW